MTQVSVPLAILLAAAGSLVVYSLIAFCGSYLRDLEKRRFYLQHGMREDESVELTHLD